jgi:uncharacterized membrane protein YkvA (DUF1232 family)
MSTIRRPPSQKQRIIAGSPLNWRRQSRCSAIANLRADARKLAAMGRGLLIALVAVISIWFLAILALVVLGRRSTARELAVLIPNLLLLFRGLLGDPRMPRGSKLWLWFAVVWLISPIDLIPEFIPVAGPLDDAIVAALVLRHVLRRTDRDVLSEHWRGDPGTLDVILRSRRRA